jgi:hypothetical protein
MPRLSAILALESIFGLFSDGCFGPVLWHADYETLAVIPVCRLDHHKLARGRRVGGRTTKPHNKTKNRRKLAARRRRKTANNKLSSIAPNSSTGTSR